jgi:cytochrome P450
MTLNEWKTTDYFTCYCLGAIIIPDIYSIHRNADLWGPEDVNLFIPERHSVKRHPAAYMAFSIGPRNCIGMRFALMELKMSLAHLLHAYDILPGEKLSQGMTLQETNVITPEAIYVRLKER